MRSQLVFAALAMLGMVWTTRRFRQRRIGGRALLIWGALWVLLGVFAVQPELTNRIADAMGIGRGVDVVTYSAIVVLFALLFRISVRLEQLDRNITKVTRELALRRNEHHGED